MNIGLWSRKRLESEVVAWLLGEEQPPRIIAQVKSSLYKSEKLRSYALNTARDLADIAEALGNPHALVDDRIEWLYELESIRDQNDPRAEPKRGNSWWWWWASVGSGIAALLVLAMLWIAFPRLHEHVATVVLSPMQTDAKQDRQDVTSAGVAKLEYEESIWIDMQMFSEPGVASSQNQLKPRQRVEDSEDTGFVAGKIMRKTQERPVPVAAPTNAPQSGDMRAMAVASESVSSPESGLRAKAPVAERKLSGTTPVESTSPSELVDLVGDLIGREEARATNSRISMRGSKADGLYRIGGNVAASGPAVEISSVAKSKREVADGYSAYDRFRDNGLGADIVGEGKSQLDQDLRLTEPSASGSHAQMLSVSENPLSTFSLNVSDASFLLAQSSLKNRQLPDPKTIRQEEFYNAFDYRDPVANPEFPVSFFAEVAQVPFTHNQQLVRFAVKAQATGREGAKPLYLTLVLDHSGSMTRVDRQEVLNAFSKELAQLLQPGDRWSLITFSENVTVQQVGAEAGQMENLSKILAQIPSTGGTNIEQALIEGYNVARRMYSQNALNRVILITDGAANIGSDLPNELARIVEENRKTGIYFDAVGVGWDDYNDTLLERLARNGEGKYRFIDSPEDVEPLIQSLAGSFRPAARDVKVQVEWNPNQVARYRLIGYETHRLRDKDFRDDTVDAAELARNEAGNALYLVETVPGGEGPLGVVRVRYKTMEESPSKELSWILPAAVNLSLNDASAAMQLAATAGFFAEMLIEPNRYPELTLEQMEQWLRSPIQVYSEPRVQELLQMIRQARGMLR
jgi:Mg-chelatase subunit ChlD